MEMKNQLCLPMLLMTLFLRDVHSAVETAQNPQQGTLQSEGSLRLRLHTLNCAWY